MKKSFVFLAAFFTLFIAFSQDTSSSKKGFLSLNLGAGIPTGEYSHKELSDKSGVASTGIFFDVNFGYVISKPIYIIASFRKGSNPVNEERYENEIKNDLPPQVNVTVDSENWKYSNFMAGLLLSFPLSNQLNLEIKGMLGISNFISPEMEVMMSETDYFSNVSQEATPANQMGLLFGGGFKIKMSENISLNIAMDYFTTDPRFEDVKFTINDSYGSYRDKENFRQSVSMMNLSAGIAYLLN